MLHQELDLFSLGILSMPRSFLARSVQRAPSSLKDSFLTGCKESKESLFVPPIRFNLLAYTWEMRSMNSISISAKGLSSRYLESTTYSKPCFCKLEHVLATLIVINEDLAYS